MVNKFKMENLKDFKLAHILENGQCFRWDRIEEQNDSAFIGVVSNNVFKISEKEKEILGNDNLEVIKLTDIYVETTMEETAAKKFLEEYFNLSENYEDIKKKYSENYESLKKATEFAYGLRILKQDEFETIISFIISANNNIKRIKKIINNISMKCGKKIEFEGKEYFGFPNIEELRKLKEEDFKSLGAGFRAKYLESTVNKIYSDNLEKYIEKLNNLSNKELEKELLNLKGVGPKVANCIMLFGFNRIDSFPIDVWVKRVMQEEFFGGEEVSNKKIEEFANTLYKKGLAQQYLFYWRREQ
ncbi:MAG: 8-oxoguanine DNA glycosylase [Clostridiales bacterium]|nr:8-oxoguanine DNA glycosylase [Clostridiales bacterium]